MIYWLVEFDDGDLVGQSGWLVLSEDLIAQKLTDSAGNIITEGISYHTVDTNPVKPEWAE